MKDLDKGCLFVRGQFWDVLQQNLACDNAIQFLERFRTCEESYAKSQTLAQSFQKSTINSTTHPTVFAHITCTALKEMWVSVWKPIFPILCLCKASKRQGHTFIQTEIGSAIIIIIWIYSWVTLPLLNHFLSSSNGPWAHSGKVSECPSCMFVT